MNNHNQAIDIIVDKAVPQEGYCKSCNERSKDVDPKELFEQADPCLPPSQLALQSS
ncbi:hypothetical protein Lser_V15G11644 [Lactuca serriola]